MKIIYHPRIRSDLKSALEFYEGEGGVGLGDRFFAEVEDAVLQASQHPRRFHFLAENYRRVSLKTFPYHLLFEEVEDVIWFQMLRHDRRHPRFGFRRR